MIQLSTTPCLPKSLDSEVAWQVEPTVEMTAVMSKRLFTSDAEWAQLLATSRSTVPATIFGLHSDLSSNVVSFYGWTKVSDSMQKVTFRLAAVHRDLVLAASGALLNFVVQELCRDAVARKERDTRTAVLWLRKTSHGDALVLLKRVSSHLGLALGNDGFGIRVAASALSDARKILFPSDSRFGTTNSQIRGALKYEIVGLPAGCSKNTIVERFAAWKNSSDEGWHVIPLQTWFSGGQTYWLVAADEAPPGHAYVMKNSRVLVRPAVSSNVAAPRPSAGSRPRSQPPRKPQRPQPFAPSAPAPADPRVTALEERMSAIEIKQASLETKLDSGFAAILSRLDNPSSTPRRAAEGPTGQTPPPKQLRAQSAKALPAPPSDTA